MDTTQGHPEDNPQAVTRYTTTAERENITGIVLDADDVEKVLDLARMGLVGAAAKHEAAVQEDMGLTASVTVELSRGGVVNADGGLDTVSGSATFRTGVQAHKEFADPAKAPQVELPLTGTGD